MPRQYPGQVAQVAPLGARPGGEGSAFGQIYVYRGQDGNINYGVPVAVMELDDEQVVIESQDLPPNTIWHYVRKRTSPDCSLMSDPSPACVVRIDADGNMIGMTPNPPAGLKAELKVDGKVRLLWLYSRYRHEIPPTGFYVYIDSGSGFDFNTPDATVTYRANPGGFYKWLSGQLVHGQLYKFCVRAYRDGAGESQNTGYVSAIADAQGPPAISGIMASWIEI